jgi:uncharacterized protein YraI
MMKKTLGAVTLLSALALPSMAMAATAIATTNVNLRAGPSTNYPAVNLVGSGDSVRVFGCLSTRSWCDVGFAGQRGWMSSNYLAFIERGRRYTGDRAIVALRAPVVSFTFGDYWDSHYRTRPFYRDRARWDRRDWREGRREERRDWREGRGEERRDRREDGRDARDGREDWRDEGSEVRNDRRGERRDEGSEVRSDRRDDNRGDRNARRNWRDDRQNGEEDWRDSENRRWYPEQ